MFPPRFWHLDNNSLMQFVAMLGVFGIPCYKLIKADSFSLGFHHKDTGEYRDKLIILDLF